MENTPTAFTALPPITPDNFFDRYHVISAGTELDVGFTHCSTLFVLVDKYMYSLEDAMCHAHTLADELREELIENSLEYVEDLVDWEAYDPDDLDSDTRYEIMYEEALRNSTVMDADRDHMRAMSAMVSDVVHSRMQSVMAAALAEVFDDETPNCGDTTNSRSEEI